MKNILKHSAAVFAALFIAAAVAMLSFAGVYKALYYLIDIPKSLAGSFLILSLFVISILISLFCGWSSYKQTNAILKRQN